LTPKERIYNVLFGGIPDRVPVSLYKINPFDENSFWVKHKSFHNLLEKARNLQDTFFFYKPKTGFFFSAPESVEIKIEEYQDKNPGLKEKKIYIDFYLYLIHLIDLT